jgi:hypothetical protein
MSLFQILLTDPVIPIPPPLFDTMQFFAVNPATSYGAVGSRFSALEPSVAGVDKPFCVSLWVAPHNVNDGTSTQRILCVGENGTNLQQWSLSLVAQSSATINQHLQFTIFGSLGTTNIQITSSARFLRARWTHVVVVYDGSESHSGLSFYFNAVEDTSATKAMTGSYTGAGDDADFRMQLGSVFSAARRFTGRMTRLDVGNQVLTSANVIELYNGGVPFLTSGVSFIAKNAARWNIETDVVCQSNALYNFSNSSINTNPQRISANYPYWSSFNGVPGNTRYVAFGSMFRVSANQWFIYQRSGTDHITNGKVVKYVFTKTGDLYTVSAPVDCIIDGTYDLRSAQSAIVGGNIIIITSRMQNGVVNLIDQMLYTSTDGLVGETFGAGVSLSSLLPSVSGNVFGKIQEGPGVGELFVSVTTVVSGTTYHVGYLKRSSGGVWSYHSIYSGTTPYTETALLNCGSGTFIGVVRHNTAGLFFVKSTDNAVTWTAPASTGKGVGVNMADLLLSHTGKVILTYAERNSGIMYINLDNTLADLLADPTDWGTDSAFFDNYAGMSISILGYPILLLDGPSAVGCFSAERSSSIADLFCCYGQVQY